MKKRFLSVWRKYHLNDLQPGCEHQREIDTTKEVEIVEFKRGERYWELNELINDATATHEQYDEWVKISPLCDKYVIEIERPKTVTAEAQELIDSGVIAIEKREFKTINWLTEKEHPEGMLSRKCPKCGYKYGSSWLKMEVPQEELEFLYNLPDSRLTPAWV